VGFTAVSIFKMLIGEYFILLFVGVLMGFATALVSTLPAFLSSNTGVSFSTVALVVALILINGVIWIVGLSWFSLQKKTLVTGLQVE